VCAVVLSLFEGILPSKISSDIRLASIHREKGVRNLCITFVGITMLNNNSIPRLAIGDPPDCHLSQLYDEK
jgi:hypothetical protein